MSQFDFSETLNLQRQSTFDSLLAGGDKYLSTAAIAETKSILKKDEYRKYMSTESSQNKTNYVTQLITLSNDSIEVSSTFEEEKENSINPYMNNQPIYDHLIYTSSDSLFDGIDVGPEMKKIHNKNTPSASKSKPSKSLVNNDTFSRTESADSIKIEEDNSTNTSIRRNDSDSSYSQDTSQESGSQTKHAKTVRFDSDIIKESAHENKKRPSIFTFSNISEVCGESPTNRNDLNNLAKDKNVKKLKGILRNKNPNSFKIIKKKKTVCFDDTKVKNKCSLCGGLASLKVTAKESICDGMNTIFGSFLNTLTHQKKAFDTEIEDGTEFYDDESTVVDLGDYRQKKVENYVDPYYSENDESVSCRSTDNDIVSYGSGESAVSVGTGVIYTINISNSPRRRSN